jgi:hypothetical protein
MGMLAVDGVIAIEVIVAFVTVNGTELVVPPRVAVIVIEPGAIATKRPVVEPIWATVVSEDDQVTRLVMFRVLPSLNVPVATNVSLVPGAMLPFAGVIEMEFRFAAFTVKEVLPVTPPKIAEIVALPTFLAVARPLVVMEATEPADDLQVETPVTF